MCERTEQQKRLLFPSSSFHLLPFCSPRPCQVSSSISFKSDFQQEKEEEKYVSWVETRSYSQKKRGLSEGLFELCIKAFLAFAPKRGLSLYFFAPLRFAKKIPNIHYKSDFLSFDVELTAVIFVRAIRALLAMVTFLELEKRKRNYFLPSQCKQNEARRRRKSWLMIPKLSIVHFSFPPKPLWIFFPASSLSILRRWLEKKGEDMPSLSRSVGRRLSRLVLLYSLSVDL